MSNETEIVIEGFPRCANTFAVISFEMSQSKKKFKIAHHLHVPAQVVRGVNLGKPVLILIREPEEAVKSLLIRHTSISSNKAFRSYISFYNIVLESIDKVIVADFSIIINNFDRVIQAVNTKFNVDFEVPEINGENESEIFSKIDRVNQISDGGRESHVARPSLDRGSSQPIIPESHLKRKAKALYDNLCQFSLKLD